MLQNLDSPWHWWISNLWCPAMSLPLGGVFFWAMKKRFRHRTGKRQCTVKLSPFKMWIRFHKKKVFRKTSPIETFSLGRINDQVYSETHTNPKSKYNPPCPPIFSAKGFQYRPEVSCTKYPPKIPHRWCLGEVFLVSLISQKRRGVLPSCVGGLLGATLIWRNIPVTLPENGGALELWRFLLETHHFQGRTAGVRINPIYKP